MLPKDRDAELLNWMSRRLFPDRTPAQEAARLEKLLGAAPGVPLTEAEIIRILQKASGKVPLQAEATHPENNGIIKLPSLRWPGQYLRRVPPRVAWAAAAACLLLVAGWMAWTMLSPRGSLPDRIAAQPIKFAGGQAKLTKTRPETQYSLVDADNGRIRLDQGGVHLEMELQTGFEAEVQTPLGKVFASDTRCYIRCLEKNGATGKDLLAVLVLDGQVRVQDKNEAGFEIAEAGELILIEAGFGPKNISPAAFTLEDQDWAIAQQVLQLLANPDIHDQLELDLPQIEKLGLAAPEEMNRAENLFQSFHTLSAAELRKKAGEFFRGQANHLLALLDSATTKKFEKLQIQQAGLAALVLKDVSQKLKLDSGQQEKIRTQLFNIFASKQALFMHGECSFLKLSKALAELEQKQTNKILDVLKPPQKQQWKELLGPPAYPYLSGMFGINKKGFNFNLFSPQPKTEEQLWESWLFKTAKQVQMKAAQFSKATQMLQDAKKKVAAYRQDKQKEFNKLAAEKKNYKNQKYDKQAHQALEQKAEALHLYIAKISQEWKDRVLEELTEGQRKAMVQAGQKEMPQGLGVPGFWDKHKKGGPGFDKHH